MRSRWALVGGRSGPHHGAMDTRARRIMSWVLLAAGVGLAAASLIRGFAEDPAQGAGWGGGVAEAVSMGVPLVGIGLALRSDRPVVRRRTAAVALVLALLAGFVLVMQLADPNETTFDRLVSATGVVLYATAALLELRVFEGSLKGRASGSPGAS